MKTQDSNEPERSSSPGMAKLITVAVIAMAGYSMVTTKHVDSVIVYALVGLAFVWLGHGADRFFGGGR